MQISRTQEIIANAVVAKNVDSIEDAQVFVLMDANHSNEEYPRFFGRVVALYQIEESVLLVEGNSKIAPTALNKSRVQPLDPTTIPTFAWGAPKASRLIKKFIKGCERIKNKGLSQKVENAEIKESKERVFKKTFILNQKSLHRIFLKVLDKKRVFICMGKNHADPEYVEKFKSVKVFLALLEKTNYVRINPEQLSKEELALIAAKA